MEEVQGFKTQCGTTGIQTLETQKQSRDVWYGISIIVRIVLVLVVVLLLFLLPLPQLLLVCQFPLPPLRIFPVPVVSPPVLVGFEVVQPVHHVLAKLFTIEHEALPSLLAHLGFLVEEVGCPGSHVEVDPGGFFLLYAGFLAEIQEDVP